MCRRNQLLGIALAGFGLGLLMACFFESGFFCGCIGLIAIGVGLMIVRHR